MPDPDYDWKVLPVDATGTATQASAVASGDTMANPTTTPVWAHVVFYNAGTDNNARARTANNFLDGAAGGTFIPSANAIFNGTTYDHEYANTDATILASAARTTATNSADIVNYSNRGVTVVLDVTSITDTPELTLTIQGKDAVSGKYYTLLAGTTVSTVSTNVYRVYPGIAATANAAASLPMPRTWRVSIAVADTDSATYSVGYSGHR